jgi:hypothetical protein
MGLITRHPNAPFQDGETLSGPDLEADISTVYAAVNGNIDTINIKDNAITTAKIANGSVTQAKLDGTLVATVADNSITTAKLVDDAVTVDKIANDSIATWLIADDAVTQAKMAPGAVAMFESSFAHTAITLTTSMAEIATATHTTGNPASLVIVTASFSITGAPITGRVIEYTVERNSVSMLGAGNVDTLEVATVGGGTQYQVTRVYIDQSPLSSVIIFYKLKARYVGGATAAPTIKDIVFVVHEPRS